MSVSPASKEETFAANRAVGRIGFVVKANAGMTRRSQVREEGPLRVRCPGPLSPELEAVIVNSSGGVAGGDRFELDVAVTPGAGLVITTAAAEKVYRSLDRDAAIDVKLKVGAGGSLAWLPQETIMFDRARLARTVDIELAHDARLVFLEAIVFGRSGMGEIVHHGRLSDRWRLYREGRIFHAEAVRLDGDVAAKLLQSAVTKGAVAVATLLVVPGDEMTAAGVRALGESFCGEVAASAWKGMMAVRFCAADGAALRHDLVAVLHKVRGRSLPRLWLN